MTVESAVFICSICGEPSSDICAYCTKDTCANHRCERCKRCSDCCECEVPLSVAEASVTPALSQAADAPASSRPAPPETNGSAIEEAPSSGDSIEPAGDSSADPSASDLD